jgi:hypothetical protein
MFEKEGRYYADWRDKDGNRKRKSFKNKNAALRYEEEQKELAHPKQKVRVSPSPRYCAPDSKGRHGSQLLYAAQVALTIFNQKRRKKA